jgi:SAM-dependent methyltransferase
MHGLGATDPGRRIDWGRTSDDYAAFRPGPPDSFYAKLAALGVGVPDQRILDLGTGTGVLARRFAAQGARCAGIDVAAGQIEAARRLAREGGLDVDFRVAPAEATPFEGGSFDAVTASQCWLYFDAPRAIAEARRVAPGGILMVSHFSWLPRLDPIAHASEKLVLEFNPQWSAADWAGDVPPVPGWAARLRLVGFFVYDAAIAFTRETWRGRMRACRGVGAGLGPDEVAAFDAAHAALLARIAPPAFTVLHRLDARLFAL